MEDAPSPWRVVLSLVERFEDALAISSLFEYRDAELLANGRSLADVLDAAPSERSVADLLAQRMIERDGGTWRYTDFYAPSRGVDPREEDVGGFVQRCSDAGVHLSYDDGTELAVPP